MHNLALALHQNGNTITGSDDAIFEPSRSRLAAKGLLPQTLGWDADKIHQGLDAIILGMHAKEDNPELQKARSLGLKIYSYPEFLYEHSKNQTRVVIGGSHGKTTITSMVLHVLNYHNIETDYMVGAQLEGFDNMVHLTGTNDFVVLEGDEYLASALDRRPKFHLYQPNIALISGIAWDHINVFPTFDDYVEQFRIFIKCMVNGGILIYNEDDEVVKQLVETTDHSIRKLPYRTPSYQIQNGQTLLETPEGFMPLQIFGAHNLNNLAGAKWICQNMGVDEADFYEAISSFKGASKRLENILTTPKVQVFKDFAHAPSKVKATTEAVKKQFPNHTVLACLELHTYSSLNQQFLQEYQHSLDAADKAVVFYTEEALSIKRLEPLSKEVIHQAFGRQDVQVFTDAKVLEAYLYEQSWDDAVLLFMSSGNYGGLDLEALKAHLKSQ